MLTRRLPVLRIGKPEANRTMEDVMADTAQGHDPQEASVAELVKQLSEQTSRLARQEVELAKTELVMKGKRAGLGAGMFGAAGLFGLYAIGALIAAAVLGLATAMSAWVAALIVAAVLGAVAGALALAGKSEVQQATPPVPEQATESVKEDVQWAKNRAQAGRQ
jgi:Putative Actinobacterial Holin-X, holin superfamily III